MRANVISLRSQVSPRSTPYHSCVTSRLAAADPCVSDLYQLTQMLSQLAVQCSPLMLTDLLPRTGDLPGLGKKPVLNTQ